MGPLRMVVGRAGVSQAEAGRRREVETKMPFKTREAWGTGVSGSSLCLQPTS